MEKAKGYIRFSTTTISRIITKSEAIDASALNITSISFKNIGDVDATINGIPLAAGDPMRSYENELPHLDITTYQIGFGTGGGSKQVAMEYKRIQNSTFVEVKEIKKCK